MRRKRKILEIAQLSKHMAKLKFSLFMMKNIFVPSHEKHAFAVKILHGSSIPNFYHLSFFARQFQRRSTTGWIIIITCPRCHGKGICIHSTKKALMQTPQNTYKLTKPSLDLYYLELWPWNTLSSVYPRCCYYYPHSHPYAANTSKPILHKFSFPLAVRLTHFALTLTTHLPPACLHLYLNTAF